MKAIIRFIFVITILVYFIGCDLYSLYIPDAEWSPNVTYAKGNTCKTTGVFAPLLGNIDYWISLKDDNRDHIPWENPDWWGPQ